MWIAGKDGKFSTTDVVEKIRDREVALSWTKFFWKSLIHPSIVYNVWKLMQGVYVDDKIMRSRGYDMVSVCCICFAGQDSMHHTLWECQFSIEVWKWLNTVFGFGIPCSFEDVCNASKVKSPLVKQLCMIVACAIMKDLWFQRNAKLFDEKKPNFMCFKSKI
ncbi:uncharacterized protein LOC113273288 [Papaver somniferum]|uniref:uncharacterized protein LOC113273288 n=1 Tax=Papaver somniferum TaxID=3469 RepID=UPI000E6F4662|nr:uncharacterized protein LOC113273288 [Papaver somniferum]